MKILILSSGLMLLASAAFAHSLHMKWAGCPNNAAATSVEDFACDGGVHNLHGTFTLSTTAPGVVAMDGIIDLRFQSQDVLTFWQFQQGACNEAALVLRDARPTINCTAANNPNTLCGAGGTGCDAFITAYAYGPAIQFPANRARLLFALARSGGVSTLSQSTGINQHFAFQFVLLEDNASEISGPCDGCLTGVAITWNQAILYNTNATAGGEAIAALLSSADPGSDATVWSNCPGCSTVGAKASTWGRLKALYR